MEAAIITLAFMVIVLLIIAIATLMHLYKVKEAHDKLEEVVAEKVGSLLFRVEAIEGVIGTHGWTDDLASERRRIKRERESGTLDGL